MFYLYYLIEISRYMVLKLSVSSVIILPVKNRKPLKSVLFYTYTDTMTGEFSELQ